jgi:hypothetical protein
MDYRKWMERRKENGNDFSGLLTADVNDCNINTAISILQYTVNIDQKKYKWYHS